MQSYITIDGQSSSEYSEKHSRFIATAWHIESEEQATEILSSLKTKYWDARHIVYAYVLHDGRARFSDDGEPHGTAGKPILDIITGSGVTDVLVTVIRYFGGILLGTGGLVRAYSSSARDAIFTAQRVEMCPCISYSSVCEYSDYELLNKLIATHNGSIESTDFTDKVEIKYIIKTEQAEVYEAALIEAFSSKISAKREKELSYPIKI